MRIIQTNILSQCFAGVAIILSSGIATLLGKKFPRGNIDLECVLFVPRDVNDSFCLTEQTSLFFLKEGVKINSLATALP